MRPPGAQPRPRPPPSAPPDAARQARRVPSAAQRIQPRRPDPSHAPPPLRADPARLPWAVPSVPTGCAAPAAPSGSVQLSAGGAEPRRAALCRPSPPRPAPSRARVAPAWPRSRHGEGRPRHPVQRPGMESQGLPGPLREPRGRLPAGEGSPGPVPSRGYRIRAPPQALRPSTSGAPGGDMEHRDGTLDTARVPRCRRAARVPSLPISRPSPPQPAQTSLAAVGEGLHLSPALPALLQRLQHSCPSILPAAMLPVLGVQRPHPAGLGSARLLRKPTSKHMLPVWSPCLEQTKGGQRLGSSLSGARVESCCAQVTQDWMQ